MSDRLLTSSPADLADYAATSSIDELRRTEYARLDEQDHVYLDYTGAGLFAESQVREHLELIRARILGNPHSASPSSSASTTLVEGARHAILKFFNAGDDYTAIFTANATGGIKHVAECYPFQPGGRLLLTADNHNSINGIREFAVAKGASVDYVPLTVPELRIDNVALATLLERDHSSPPGLFAYPAQSNFSGVKHPLELVEAAHARGWDVLLDAAAFVPTNRLDLSSVKPDFVPVSFYKMCGYPTGVGCLLVRNAALHRLHRPWFAGGTVNFASVLGRAYALAPGEAGFEDGTLNFLSIPAVEIGLRHLERVGLDTIRARVGCLAEWLIFRLLDLRHANGRHVIRIYGPTSMAMRGGTITMNCYDPNGHLLDYRRVEELAAEQRISFRTGCFCNPGVGEIAEGLSADTVREVLAHGGDLTLPRIAKLIQEQGEGKSVGAIRVSLGIASNARDVERFLGFIASLRDQTRLAIGETSFDIESCRVIRDGS